MDNNIFGLSEKALQLCEDRSTLLTSNIVNSSTPHYKARDIDFHKALQDANQNASTLLTTNQNHISSTNQLSGGEPIMYRIPHQMSLDGNTVDDELERKNFIENALRYQVNLTFIQSKTEQIMKALKGE